ncbi:AraC family transcriptional regulator [Butyrivibrio fibrisolvens]|jgi:AraC-like DNA-binding protein|uniref:AraC family transcriptional regulator n=1 Tax=Butyrivibrio fibrisolvens TaxID=831 RepID=A0A1H9NV09_BUTFI|nr:MULTISPECIES: AraC family transcriptional regulator [Butyrivibrio]MBQ1459209.1 helix-turn-helix transcriptional regulator [Butyrivibrio sp.]MCR4636629.1 AraC family transcriptional regulator [Butyrivibrio sp.]PWT26917.1 AraC family transcriptional regulator [Butyrivibrio fibrisolvens]SER39505.1 AraC-like ligand binding domain-containing protein [Butyrivibrio fibrisolvens]
MENYLFHGNLVASNRILYTPSQFAKSSLIHLQEVGSLQATRQHTSSRQGLGSYLFFLIESGSGSLSYEGKTYALSAGDCVFIDCRKPYSHTTSKELWKLDWVHFQGTNMENIYQKYIERGGAPLFHADNPKHYLDLIDNIYGIASSDDYLRDMKIYEQLTKLLTLLMEESWNPENMPENTAGKKKSLQDIKAYLETNYVQKLTLDDLSARFYINKYYLTRIFKEQYGSTITGYILELRITRAKHLLRFTEMPIDDIASAVGIGDSNYFSRIFRKIEGTTPHNYRKLWSQL